MKRSKFTDEQILAIVKEGEAGRKVAEKPSSAGWSSARCNGSSSWKTRTGA
jgi:hypothetical protein